MPRLTFIDIGLVLVMLAAGLVAGWVIRARRCAGEKVAVSAGWQAQMDAQQSEHDRLADQNRSLMEQISQYQASNKDSNMRAKELSDSLKEAFERRDQLQRQLKEIRGNLEIAVAQRDRLQSDVQSRKAQGDAASADVVERDEKIRKLSRELRKWQDRVPPLVERFSLRDKEARLLEEQLQEAKERATALENVLGSGQTRIEPVDGKTIPPGMDASNEPDAGTSGHRVAELTDQVDEQMHNPGGESQQAADTDTGIEDDVDKEQLADSNGEWQQATDTDTGIEDDVDKEQLADASGESQQAADTDTGIEDDLDKEQLPDSSGEWQQAADSEPEIAGVDEGPDAQTGQELSTLSGVSVADTNWWDEIEDEDDQPANDARDRDDNNDEERPDSHEGGENGEDRDEQAANPDRSRNVESETADHDDLKLIKGVGPAIEQTLNDLGIYRFNQIAEMSEYDIDRVAQQLRGFRSRIYREDWIGQARTLQHRKNND